MAAPVAIRVSEEPLVRGQLRHPMLNRFLGAFGKSAAATNRDPKHMEML